MSWAVVAAVILVLIAVLIPAIVHFSHGRQPMGDAAPTAANSDTSPADKPAIKAPSAASQTSAPSPPVTAPSKVASPPIAPVPPSNANAAPPMASSSPALNPDGFALPMTAAPGTPSLTGACQWQYGDPNAIAKHVPGSDPTPSYTVHCLDGATDHGGLNLNGYCDNLLSGMRSDNPDRYGSATDQPRPWEQWECVPG